jgi:hypothetical protein
MLEFLRITEDGSLPAPKTEAPYKCVIVVEAEVSPARQMEISRWLVSSGCLYMMAWGIGCSSWDDSVDLANLEQFGFEDTPDKSFVMTTWHESESLREVFEFSRLHVELTRLLILQVNGIDRKQELLEMASNA